MQSHKRIEESAKQHIGSSLTTSNLQLYSSAGQWYIAAPKVRIKRDYPLVYDTIYGDDDDNTPVDKVVEGSQNGLLYMPISHGTASVLQRPDGYSDLQSLLEESKNSGKQATPHLSAATRHSILASIDSKGKSGTCYIYQTTPEKPAVSTKVLSAMDKYTVDAVGTLIYNVSIPFTAPFRFFRSFLAED